MINSFTSRLFFDGEYNRRRLGYFYRTWYFKIYDILDVLALKIVAWALLFAGFGAIA